MFLFLLLFYYLDVLLFSTSGQWVLVKVAVPRGFVKVKRVMCQDRYVAPEGVISAASRMFLNTQFQHFWLNLLCIDCGLNALKFQHSYKEHCRCEIFLTFALFWKWFSSNSVRYTWSLSFSVVQTFFSISSGRQSFHLWIIWTLKWIINTPLWTDTRS